MYAAERSAYLQELRICITARSAWLLRNFIKRHGSILGRLGTILEAKTDEQLALLVEEVDKALTGQSDNQLATQLCAPWLLPRDQLKP